MAMAMAMGQVFRVVRVGTRKKWAVWDILDIIVLAIEIQTTGRQRERVRKRYTCSLGSLEIVRRQVGGTVGGFLKYLPGTNLFLVSLVTFRFFLLFIFSDLVARLLESHARCSLADAERATN